MTVLVAAASKHGSTYEIAEAIGARLRLRGFDVDVAHVENVLTLEGYRAVVLGSGAYFGRWRLPAEEFARHHADELRELPVWLFSSGPLGTQPKPAPADAVHVEELLERTGAREHRLFDGKLDRHELGRIEKAIVSSVHAEEGDFRDWEAIAAWADGIAAALAAEPVGAATPR